MLTVTHGQSGMKLFIGNHKSAFNGFLVILKFSSYRTDAYSLHLLLQIFTIMAQLPDQETAEYYNWLFKIEAREYEKELLEIVSSISYLMRKTNIVPQ